MLRDAQHIYPTMIVKSANTDTLLNKEDASQIPMKLTTAVPLMEVMELAFNAVLVFSHLIHTATETRSLDAYLRQETDVKFVDMGLPWSMESV